jgi:hypothetical protein
MKSVAIVILVSMLVMSLFLFVRYLFSKCDGPPYLYVTFHDKISNVWKYSRNGCLLSTKVLNGEPHFFSVNHTIELRSLAIGKYKNRSVMYVADAYTNDSFLSIYGECNELGEREYVRTAVSTVENNGVSHIYGVCFDHRENLYVSSQRTDNVMRFQKDTFQPMGFPSYFMLTYNKYLTNYPGTFIQFGAPNAHELTEQGVRDIVTVGEFIWVANKDIHGVLIIDSQTGLVEDIVPVAMPIGLFYYDVEDIVFVGSKAGDNCTTTEGKVLGISTKTRQVVRTLQSHHLDHPTGITAYGGVLYVADQATNKIFSFDIRTGRYKSTVVESMPDSVEKVILSDC